MTHPVQPVTFPDRSEKIAALLANQQQQRSTPTVLTKADYAEAVELLVNMAQTGCSGARAAAQVLLSTYNGHSWQCNLVDLCNLDCAHYRAAIIVIRGRVELNSEPQRLLAGGDAVFAALEEEWQAFHIRNRGQKH